jgi:hypothetical protein
MRFSLAWALSQARGTGAASMPRPGPENGGEGTLLSRNLPSPSEIEMTYCRRYRSSRPEAESMQRSSTSPGELP